ncbi:MAG: hypothetical protein ACRDAI_03395 [Candidatus Rhabdochlamydia sp.]
MRGFSTEGKWIVVAADMIQMKNRERPPTRRERETLKRENLIGNAELKKNF